MLAPHHAEDAQFGERGLAAKQVKDLLILVGRDAVVSKDFGSDGNSSGIWHVSGNRGPVLFIFARPQPFAPENKPTVPGSHLIQQKRDKVLLITRRTSFGDRQPAAPRNSFRPTSTPVFYSPPGILVAYNQLGIPMEIPDLVRWYAPERRNRALVLTALGVIFISATDYIVVPNIGLGFLYIFPILLAAGFLQKPQIVILTGLCALFREAFSPFHHGLVSIPRTLFVWAGFATAGWFMRELVTSRQQAVEHTAQLQSEIDLRMSEARRREDAERQVNALIESSPAAIVMVTESGVIELSNEAARRLFGTDESLLGKSVTRYIPDLPVIQNRLGIGSSLRTAVECRGIRENGEIFLGNVWMSRFQTHAGLRVALIVSDASEQLRDREQVGLEQSLANSRLLVAAVSHEIRNLCSAVAIAHTNLSRFPGLEENTDFKSLGLLVQGLRQLSSAELMPVTKAAQEGLQLKTIFDDLRIVLQTAAEDASTELMWDVSPDLPAVRADRQGLFQVFLNLSHNSFRAMQQCSRRMLTISTQCDINLVTIRFRDTGPGVGHPDQLFKLFHSGNNSSGIGLYISRAILRSYGADIRYEFSDTGACFAIELLRAQGAPN